LVIVCCDDNGVAGEGAWPLSWSPLSPGSDLLVVVIFGNLERCLAEFMHDWRVVGGFARREFLNAER
jgi:hypothetical protein